LEFVDEMRRLVAPSPVTNDVTSAVTHVPVLTAPMVALGDATAAGAVFHVTDPWLHAEPVVGRTTPPAGEGSATNMRNVAELTVDVPTPVTLNFMRKSLIGEPSVCRVVAVPKFEVAEPWMIVASSVGVNVNVLPPLPEGTVALA
jgi:hypothetical protein